MLDGRFEGPGCVSQREEGEGPTQPAPTADLRNLARLYEAMGAYAEARSVYQRVLTLEEAERGDGDLRVAQALGDLGWVLEAAGTDSQASPLYERALAIHRQHLGPDHPEAKNAQARLHGLGRPTPPPVATGSSVAWAGEPSGESWSLGELARGLAPALHPYWVEARLLRRRGGSGEGLAPGAAVAPGDELYLELRGTVTLYVYVLNEDDRGESYLLFPLPGLGLANPLAADAIHRLPGPLDREQVFWRVTSAGGREHFLIVASPHRLVELESELVALPRPEMDRPVTAAPLSESGEHRLRGLGGLAHGPVAGRPAQRRRIFELAATLPAGAERSRGVWIRQIELENP